MSVFSSRRSGYIFLGATSVLFFPVEVEPIFFGFPLREADRHEIKISQVALSNINNKYNHVPFIYNLEINQGIHSIQKSQDLPTLNGFIRTT